MTPRRLRRDLFVLVLLAVLPALAHAPAWLDQRLLGPGDGAALHYPLRAAVWASLGRGELPGWNDSIFLGTPLLAAYRPGAFYPPMAALFPLPSFAAFQLLVLFSLAASAGLVFLYVRRLGAERVGGFVAGLSFSLGPYLLGHLGDTATVVAAPLLPLVLLAAESHMNRGTPRRAAGLSLALALLLLAGSPEAARAGLALLAGRLLVGHLLLRPERGPRWSGSILAVLAGLLLAAPQLVPTLLAATEAGRAVTGLASSDRPLPGAFGLVLRYASHTPTPSLALAALPLALTQMPIRVLGLALGLSVALQWGRGPLAAPGAVALVLDLTLSVLAGVSLSAQWRARSEPLGRRLRAYFLAASLASAAALSVAAAALGPLPQTLAGAVGVLALSLILYFSLAASPHPLRAGVWLLPLTVSFLLQPAGRGVAGPSRRELEYGSVTREAVDRVLGTGRGERTLALVRAWPRGAEADLAYGNLGGLVGRRNANGYDPLTPLRTRAALGSMSVGGVLPGAFFRSDPARLEALGIRWVQVPLTALATTDPGGDPLDITIRHGGSRLLPVPISAATAVHVVSFLSEGVDVPQDQPVLRVRARLATGRDFELDLRAGVHTAEWAYDRADVRPRVAHRRAPIFESWRAGDGFEGHRYEGVLPLPGRYNLDGLFLERLPGRGHVVVSRLALIDRATGTATPVSLPAAYVSEAARFRERAVTPGVRLYEVLGAAAARVVGGVQALPDDAAVLRALGAPGTVGLDPRVRAVTTVEEAARIPVPPGARPGRAEVVGAVGGRVEVRAEGPGILVLARAWDPGWRVEVDGAPAALARVHHAVMGVALGPGVHRAVFRHRAHGLLAGALLAAAAGVALALAALRI